MEKIKAVVLAAGQGKRLFSQEAAVPKVMRLCASRPLMSYVLRALDFIQPADTVVVTGFMKEVITEYFGPSFSYCEQKEQLGTGHAVLCAMQALPDFDGRVLVCCGDMPLVRRETYLALLENHRAQKNACTILASRLDDPTGYGRVICADDGAFLAIVEERDCSPAQKEIRTVNTGVYVFDAPALRAALPRLGRLNAQGEYYLTDLPGLLRADGLPVGVLESTLSDEAVGVNTVEQLEYAGRRIVELGLAF